MKCIPTQRDVTESDPEFLCEEKGSSVDTGLNSVFVILTYLKELFTYNFKIS